MAPENTNPYFIPGEKGIVKVTSKHFQMVSPFARDHLFYTLIAGDYNCEAPYEVRREYLDSYIIFFVMEGQMHFEYQGNIFAAPTGSIVLLDCHQPNHYWAESMMRQQFFHFTGNISRDYCDLIFERNGQNEPVFKARPETAAIFTYILDEFNKVQPNEHKISSHIMNLLSMLAYQEQKDLTGPASAAITYMHEHLTDMISVDQLAAQISLSKYHFSRIFKQQTGYAPHEYLLNLRIQKAKEYLCNTRNSVEEIAELCGFSSPSNFIRAFHKQSGFTPASYRKLFSTEWVD